MDKIRKHHLWIITFSLIILFALFSFRLNEPLFGHREGAVVWIAATVRMYNQYGMDALSYLPIRTMGPATPENVYYYLHHPPLTVWFSAWGTWLFGYNTETGAPYESSLRIVALFLTMPTLCLIYAVANRLTDRKSALWAFLLYSFTPMTIYFSRTPIFDMMVLPFVLAFTFVFFRWMNEFKIWQTVSLAIIAIIIIWTAWVGAFLIAPLGLVALIYGDKRQKLWMLFIGAVAVLATIAVPALYETLKPGAVTNLINIFSLRISNATAGTDSINFTALEFLGQWLRDMFTVVSLALTAFGLWGLGYLLAQRRDLKAAIMIALVSGALAFMLVFRNAFYFHDWYEIAFMPGLAIIAGWVVYRGGKLRPRGLQRFAKPLIFAIIVCSLGVTAYWTALMHQATFNDLTRSIAIEIPLYTEELSEIATNIDHPYDEAEYYAYRRIRWGVPIADAVEFYETEESVDLYYLICPDFGEPEEIESAFADLAYETINGDCRLVHLQK